MTAPDAAARPNVPRGTVVIGRPRPRRTTRQLARWAALAVAFLLNALAVRYVAEWYAGRPPGDWLLWAHLPTGSPYTLVPFRASPVAAWLLAPVIVWAGPLAFAVLHPLALLALPRRMAAIVGISFAFWLDLVAGNVFTFVFVAGYLALRGSRPAAIAYIVLTLLMPRPVQVPLLAWLLWKQPGVRPWFAGLFVAHAALALSTGYAGDWIGRLVESSSGQMAASYNFGPTALVGYAWFVVGIPVAVLLWRRGRPGLAGLALSPYILAQYWLFALLGDVQPEVAALVGQQRRDVGAARVGP